VRIFISFGRHVYGQVTDFQSVPLAIKLFKLAHKLQLDCLAYASANFIGGHDFKATEIFYIFDLFVQKGNTNGVLLCSKSKVYVP
jgi:hypothetical protein